jgi:hypothetical protein
MLVGAHGVEMNATAELEYVDSINWPGDGIRIYGNTQTSKPPHNSNNWRLFKC